MRQKEEGSLIVLNRSIVIGIVLLITTLSFTFGYFVGRYSVPKSEGPSVVSQVQESQRTPQVAEEERPGGLVEKDDSDLQVVPSAPQAPVTGPSEKPKDSGRETPHLKKGFYYLQVGAFKSPSGVQKMKERFEKEDYELITKKDGSVERVYLGAFKTRKEALLAQTRIKKLYGIDSIIIKE